MCVIVSTMNMSPNLGKKLIMGECTIRIKQNMNEAKLISMSFVKMENQLKHT